MNKSLFESDEQWTDEARGLDDQLQAFLRPIFREYMGQGYSVREISHIVMLAAFDCEMMAVLDKRDQKATE